MRFSCGLFLVLLGMLPAASKAANVTDGLLYEWQLDEKSGMTSVDSISGRNLQSSGLPTQGAAGISGSAYALDGHDDYLVSSANNETFGKGDFTVSAWVRTSSAQTKVAPLVIHNSADGWFELTLHYDGRPYVFAQDRQTQAYVDLEGGAVLTDNQWHLITFVRAGERFSLYADSTLIESETNPAIANLSGFAAIDLGGTASDYHSGGKGYVGLLDDVTVYSRALSAAEVAANAVPEPSTAFLLSGGFLLVASRRRRVASESAGV